MRDGQSQSPLGRAFNLLYKNRFFNHKKRGVPPSFNNKACENLPSIGFEPMTFPMSRERATTAPTGRKTKHGCHTVPPTTTANWAKKPNTNLILSHPLPPPTGRKTTNDFYFTIKKESVFFFSAPQAFSLKPRETLEPKIEPLPGLERGVRNFPPKDLNSWPKTPHHEPQNQRP